jgi:chemotaxis protein methyltransferase CheR
MRTTSRIAFAPTPRLSKLEFDEIRQLAYRTFGLDLKPGKEEMVSARLGRLLKAGGFGSFHDYACHVSADSTGVALGALVDALATNHTAFLREPEHFDFFGKRVIPELARQALPEIWCAACASGEEAWTLACMWNEACPVQSLRIYASDVSSKALRRARAGEYSADNCASIPRSWLDRYFERCNFESETPEPSYRVGARLRSQVEFRRINLVQPLPWQRQFPVIFCCNVMIYFDRQTQQDVVHRLTDCLDPGGYLFTGHAENLAGISHTLEYVRPALYRKPGLRRAA